MYFKRRKCLRKYLDSMIFLFNITFISCSVNINHYHNNNYDKYDLKSLSLKISDKLKQATYVELGVTSMQKMYNTLQFTTEIHNEENMVEQIAKRLQHKIVQAFDILNIINYDIINNSVINTKLPLHSQVYVFPENAWQSNKNENVKENESYIVNNFDSKYFTNILNQVNNSLFGLKQTYFLSRNDLGNNINFVSNYLDIDDSYIWNLYTSLTKIKHRNIIMALDLGNTFNNKIFDLAKKTAKIIVSMLESTDRIGILAFGYDWNSPYITGYNCQISTQSSPLTTDECKVYPATLQNKNIFYTFIDSLTRINGSINHEVVFKQLLKSAKLNFESQSEETLMLLYITPGSYLSYNETSNILTELSKIKLDISTVINTIFLQNGKNIFREHFLKDISELNLNKYNINFSGSNNYIPGLMQTVTSTTGLGLIVARLFNTLPSKNILHVLPGITLPAWQESTRDFIISVYIPCGNTTDLGLLGLDISFSNIAEDITYYSNHKKYTYAFLLNIDGSVLLHHSFTRPIVTYKQPKFVDISYFEKYENFSLVRDSILHKKNGLQQIFVKNETVKYVWRRVLHWYIVCIVIVQDQFPNYSKKVTLPDTSTHYNLLHHRLDLLPPPTLCRHLNQISTLDTGIVYLSASCFQSPYSYLRGIAGFSVSSVTLQSYMAYIKDNTKLLANPGLKDNVRSDVTILSYMLKYLMKQHLHGSLHKYTVRRYIATMNGVMLMYPGLILDVEVEPTRRNWFVRAMDHPGKIVLTSPYLDAGGAGYIVTISHTIYDKTSSNNILAVMAMDVTFGYIYKLLLETVPYCTKQENVKCFMIDDKGYLIYHPNLIDLNRKGPIEQQHIIHKESQVANDLLNHKEFVKKILCNNYADGTIQRYYKFNTSLDSVLSNLIHGEHCVKYFITAIPNTNTFVGVVNFTCTDVATFCPCSTVNRLCLICNRVEQNECECPCECPLHLNNDMCPQVNKSLNDNQLCTANIENSQFTSNNMYYSIAAGLKPCLPFLCEIHTTYDTCVGLLGCEWCYLDVDGETKLQNPFCTSLTMCFHGVLGSLSPYRDINLEPITSDDLFISTYSSVGPAAGSIVALCFILALVFYCYRQYSLQFMERLYPNSTSNRIQHMQMSSINVDNFNDDTSSHQDKLLSNIPKNVGPVSPYCISTEYRKPTTGVDSDLGYSTMTPHEESERLSFALIELDSFDDDCNTSDAISTNTSVIAYKSPKLVAKNKQFPKNENSPDPSPGITSLNNKHCILASVTVHRNMETI